MKQFLLKMVSGPDNQTPDLARVLFLATWCMWAFSCFLYLFLVVTFGHDADKLVSGYINLFGIGTGLLVGGSASVFIKHNTEPKKDG